MDGSLSLFCLETWHESLLPLAGVAGGASRHARPHRPACHACVLPPSSAASLPSTEDEGRPGGPSTARGPFQLTPPVPLTGRYSTTVATR